jgi:hypothetical protein
MQRNATHVMQSLTSSGISVFRFEVQKLVKGGSKGRLLIVNMDLRVLIQVRLPRICCVFSFDEPVFRRFPMDLPNTKSQFLIPSLQYQQA